MNIGYHDAVILLLILSLCILPFIVLFVYANRHKMLMEILPSIFWLFFMSLPFFFLSLSVQSDVEYVQAFGVILVSGLTQLTDFISLRIHIKKARNLFLAVNGSRLKPFIRKFILFVILFLILVVPILHISASHVFPLLELLRNSDSSIDLPDARQAFTKGANFGLFFHILVTWFVPIFSVISCFILYKLGFKKTIIFVMFLSCIYAVASLEKFQLLFLIFTFYISFRYLLNAEKNLLSGNKFVKIFITFCLVLNILGICMVIAGVSHRNDTQVQNHISNHKTTGSFFTPSDYYRLGIVNNSFFPERIENFVYRTVLAPVDVSFRWYQYYSIRSENRNIREFITNSEEPKASNILANWYLVDRFPDKYRSYANAYTSIDADAYSVYGKFGIMFFVIILSFVRILAKLLSFKSSFSCFIYGMIVAHLSVLPMMAGIWSILFSRGVIILLFISFVSCFSFYYLKNWNNPFQ